MGRTVAQMQFECELRVSVNIGKDVRDLVRSVMIKLILT